MNPVKDRRKPRPRSPSGSCSQGGAETGRRLPADRRAAVANGANVHAAVDHHVEVEPGTGAKLEHPHAPLGTVPEDHQPDPGDGVQPAQAARQLAPRQLPVIHVRHGCSLPDGRRPVRNAHDRKTVRRRECMTGPDCLRSSSRQAHRGPMLGARRPPRCLAVLPRRFSGRFTRQHGTVSSRSRSRPRGMRSQDRMSDALHRRMTRPDCCGRLVQLPEEESPPVTRSDRPAERRTKSSGPAQSKLR